MDERYDRNIKIPGFGEAGQEALFRARILVIGAGGLGSPALLYLAAAGVGALGVCDGDSVSLSNLQRQILYRESDLGRNKAEAACDALLLRNSALKLTCLPEFLTPARMAALVPAWDCVLDCTDTLFCKLSINDACVRAQTPYVHAGVSGLAGQLMSVLPGHACLRCAFPDADETAPEPGAFGTLGAAAGMLGALQASEAVKLVTGFATPLCDALLHVDLGSGNFLRIPLKKNAACPACGNGGSHAT